ncbi:MAG: hypothetical protein KDD69_15390, partial [Bdellovibrionales bacterium]|nr:hypothetical protein [Bdellovibrionales bacterium]
LSLRKWLATIGIIARRFSHLATSCGNLGELSQTLFPFFAMTDNRDSARAAHGETLRIRYSAS